MKLTRRQRKALYKELQEARRVLQTFDGRLGGDAMARREVERLERMVARSGAGDTRNSTP